MIPIWHLISEYIMAIAMSMTTEHEKRHNQGRRGLKPTGLHHLVSKREQKVQNEIHV